MKKITCTLLLITFTILSYAQTTTIPDANFEQALIDLGIDTNGLNGNILNSDAANVTYVNVDAKSINDLTGIEAFTSLTTLYCNDNNLTSFDASVVPTLTNLAVWRNNLTNLNVNSNTALYTLSCDENNLTNLDVSNLTGLIRLYCGSNNISILNLSGNPNLITLDCYGLNLTSLDFTNNLNFQELYAGNNQLTTLDLSNLSNFKRLSCANNNLTSLNIKNGNNTNVTYFNASNNSNLTCIDVDNVVYSDANWSLPAQTIFSTDCSSPTATVNDMALQSAILYPNPVKDILHIENKSEISTISIYDLLGKVIRKQVYTHKNKIQLDISTLKAGNYIVKIRGLQKVEIIKFIKV